MKKVKYYSNGKKKKEVFDIVKNDYEFKLIINYFPDGNISSIIEKPNLKIIDSCVLVSGAHVFANWKHNHCDFFQSGALVCKEYPKNLTNYGYTISGAILVV